MIQSKPHHSIPWKARDRTSQRLVAGGSPGPPGATDEGTDTRGPTEHSRCHGTGRPEAAYTLARAQSRGAGLSPASGHPGLPGPKVPSVAMSLRTGTATPKSPHPGCAPSPSRGEIPRHSCPSPHRTTAPLVRTRTPTLGHRYWRSVATSSVGASFSFLLCLWGSFAAGLLCFAILQEGRAENGAQICSPPTARPCSHRAPDRI